jgi:hypothetical protein
MYITNVLKIKYVRTKKITFKDIKCDNMNNDNNNEKIQIKILNNK